MPRTNFGPELTDEQMEEREKSIFKGIGDDAMEAPDQQRMTPQVSENAAVEQVDLHFVGLVDTEEETVDAKMFHELGESLDVHALGKHDITEIFSPARFTRSANSFGLKPGYAIDLETSRGNGERWDLTNKTHQKDLEAILKVEDPYLLTGSPPCERRFTFARSEQEQSSRRSEKTKTGKRKRKGEDSGQVLQREKSARKILFARTFCPCNFMEGT